MRRYCLEESLKVAPEHFHDYYTTNGWTQGKGKPIRDWKAAARTWARNRFHQPNTTTPKNLTPIGEGRLPPQKQLTPISIGRLAK